MDKLYISCEDVAARYGVPVSTVWSWCRKGIVEATKIGKRYYIKPEALEAMEAENANRK